MQWEWIKSVISPVSELVGFLQKKSTTNDVHKKQMIRELKNNLNIFLNAYKVNEPENKIIDLLKNDAIKEAIKNNFNFRKLKTGKITQRQIFDKRNQQYLGWDAERLVEKIDEKIEELKNIRQ